MSWIEDESACYQQELYLAERHQEEASDDVPEPIAAQRDRRFRALVELGREFSRARRPIYEKKQ